MTADVLSATPATTCPRQAAGRHARGAGLVGVLGPPDPAGPTWSSLIEEKLTAAKAVVVVWSRTSVQSEWVKAEAMAARDRGILVPVRIDAAPIPLPFGLIQTANLDPEAAGGSDDIPHLMTNLSRLVALPVTDTKAAARLAPPRRPPQAARPGTDWKQVLFELDGRINRKFYWIGILVLACLGFPAGVRCRGRVSATQPGLPRVEVASQAGTLSFFVFLYPTIVLAVKRFHDINWSGWWAAPLMVSSFIGRLVLALPPSRHARGSGRSMVWCGSVQPRPLRDTGIDQGHGGSEHAWSAALIKGADAGLALPRSA